MDAIRLCDTRNMNHKEWLAARRLGLGGSDIPIIAGLSPYRSKMALYLDKIGELEEQEDNEFLYWGRKLESVIAERFFEETGLIVRRVNSILAHPEHRWALANIDRLILSPKGDGPKGQGILEIKTANAYASKDWDNNRIPDIYYCQLQWYFFVTGLNWGWFATLVGGNRYYQYFIERDEELIGLLFKYAQDFWRLVENKTPPPLDGTLEADAVLKAIYPVEAVQPDELFLDGNNAETLAAHYLFCVKKRKEWESEEMKAEQQLKALIGNHPVGFTASHVVTWRPFEKQSLDTRALKEEHPDIYEAYLKQTSYRRFAVKLKEDANG